MEKETPESEFSIECFQNYTAPEVFIQGLAGMVNQSDVETMIRAQKQMLQRFEKTNEMLTNCNALSASRLKLAGAEFKKHTQLLIDMKKDLDYIFKKIRAIKLKLSTQYPEAFEAAQKAASANSYREEDEFEEGESSTGARSTNLTKDISKSTETLRPSISQVFSGEQAAAAGPSERKEPNVVVSDNKSDSPKTNDEKEEIEGKEKSAETNVVKHKKTVVDKEKRESSGSSSSDNSNTCGESSGDCTSDTG